MVQIVATPRRVGGSLMFAIPKEVVKFQNIRPGKSYRFEVIEDDAEKDCFGAFPGIGPWKKEPASFYSKYL